MKFFINKWRVVNYLILFVLFAVVIIISSLDIIDDTLLIIIMCIVVPTVLFLAFKLFHRPDSLPVNQELDVDCNVQKFRKKIQLAIKKHQESGMVNPIKEKLLQFNLCLCLIYEGRFTEGKDKIENIYNACNEEQQEQLIFFKQLMISLCYLLGDDITSFMQSYGDVSTSFTLLPPKIQTRDQNSPDAIYCLIKDSHELFAGLITDNGYSEIINKTKVAITKNNRYYILSLYYKHLANKEGQDKYQQLAYHASGNVFYMQGYEKSED